MSARTAASALLASSFLTCLGGGCSRAPNLERSCRGEYVIACEPYEWSEVASATFEPTRLSPGDPRESATVHVELRGCGASMPAPTEVQIAAVVSEGGGIFPLDALGQDVGPPGDGTRVYQLTSVRAGAVADAVIDVTIDNPFDGRIPAETDLILRFTPVVSGCEGAALTVPYRTGPRPTP